MTRTTQTETDKTQDSRCADGTACDAYEPSLSRRALIRAGAVADGADDRFDRLSGFEFVSGGETFAVVLRFAFADEVNADSAESSSAETRSDAAPKTRPERCELIA